MTLYLDASAIVAILLMETSSEAVENLLRTARPPLVSSSFCVGECAAALTALVRMNRKSQPQTTSLLRGLDAWIEKSFETTPTQDLDIGQATLLVRRFDLSLRLPDAIHIVTANRLNATLVTLDRGMARAAEILNIPCINPAEASAA